MNTDLSIDFIKNNCKTIADLKKRCDERRLLLRQQETPFGVARHRNKQNTVKEVLSPDTAYPSSLMPHRTLNFTKLKQARDNLETEQVFKELGVEIL